MTKSKATVLASGLWIAGLASAAAFAYTMNRPLTVQPPSTDPAPLRLVRVDPTPPPEPRLIVLPTVEIVGEIVRPVRPAPRALPKVRDISEMKCTEFKTLAQGSGGVQLCE